MIKLNALKQYITKATECRNKLARGTKIRVNEHIATIGYTSKIFTLYCRYSGATNEIVWYNENPVMIRVPNMHIPDIDRNRYCNASNAFM